MTLQTNDRVGYRIMARALPQESQLCHDRSGDAGMPVIFLSFSHSHTHTKGDGEMWRNQEEKEKRQAEALVTGTSQWQPDSLLGLIL